MKKILILIILLLNILLLNICYGISNIFLGVWKGIPETSIVGPFLNNFTFNIKKINNNEWLFFDKINNYNTGGIKGTTQKWWYINKTLWYCGILIDFFTYKHPRYVKLSFKIMHNSSNKIIFCEKHNGCNYMLWKLKILSKNRLHSLMYMPPPIKHLDVIYNKIYNLNKVTYYDDFKCNFIKNKSNKSNKLICPFNYINKINYKKKIKKNINCYIFNKKLDYRIYWKIYEKYIDISISCITNGWISIGFQGNNNSLQTMKNTDIILGYLEKKNNKVCIKNMYSYNNIGLPYNNGNMSLFNISLIYLNKRLILNFTRLLKSGVHNINNNNNDFQLLWAIGNNNINDCNKEPIYHGNNRGFRNINWFNPELSFVDNIRCNQIF